MSISKLFAEVSSEELAVKKRIVSKIDNKNKTKIHKWGTRKGKFLSKRNKKNIALRAASAACIIGLFIF